MEIIIFHNIGRYSKIIMRQSGARINYYKLEKKKIANL